MSRHRLKVVAANVASKFIARYNDIEGYWALGVLYALSAKAGNNSFEINMFTGESSPCLTDSQTMILPYTQFLQEQAHRNNIDLATIQKASIKVEFNIPATPELILKKLTWGEPFRCTAMITDDLNKSRSASIYGWCGIHCYNR